MVDVVPRLSPEGVAKITLFMRARPEGFASLEETADAVAAYNPHRPRPKDVTGLIKNLRRRADGRLHWHWDPAFARNPQSPEPPQLRSKTTLRPGRARLPAQPEALLQRHVVLDQLSNGRSPVLLGRRTLDAIERAASEARRITL
jgi:hypothetical protein